MWDSIPNAWGPDLNSESIIDYKIDAAIKQECQEMINEARWQYFSGRIRTWELLALFSILLIAYGMYAGEPSQVYTNARVICTSCIGIR